MSVTLLEVMAAARTRAASLVAEVAGYLVLGIADQVVGAPRVLGGADVSLDREGALRMLGGRATTELDAESALRALLRSLLSVSVSVTPALLRTSDKPSAGSVAGLVRELEAALIPVNRAAARRALARLYRDVERARDTGRLKALSEPPAAVIAAPPPPVCEEEPSLAAVALAVEEASPDPFEVTSGTPLTPEPEPEPEPEAHASQPITAPEPIVRRRSILEPSVLSPMVPSPIVVWDVPDLEPPPSPEICVDVYEPGTEPPLELVGPDATERAPTLMTLEVTAPLPPVTPVAPTLEIAHPERSLAPPNLDDLLEDAPWHQSSEHTPGLGHLLTAVRALARPVQPADVDPDELVIEPERTLPLPPAPTPPPPAWMLAAHDEVIGLEAQPMDELFAFQAPDPDPDSSAEPAPDPDPEVMIASPIAPMPVVAVEKLSPAPERPRVVVPAPPRFQPKQSDVDALVADFKVSDPPAERAVCESLKRMAGVDRTQAPPQVATRTPPPVEVGSEPEETVRPSIARGSRIGLGALALALVASGAGAVSSAVSSTSTAPAAATGLASVEPAAPPACDATLEITGVPTGARTLVRAGALGTARIPTRIDGSVAVFEGLRCSESLEVTVGTDDSGQRRWVRIPVSAEAMTPSPEDPSSARVSLSVE